MRLFARLRNLLRGTLGRWLGRQEHENPAAVFESAIHERVAQYATLREAAAGVIYMRQKLEGQLAGRREELARLERQLDVAVERNDDAAALALITRRDQISGDVERLTQELAALTEEADAAKRNLVAFQHEIERLREERTLLLARLANAKARLRLQETLSGLSPEADIRALEGVRDHVNRLVAEVHLAREGADPALERRLGVIRDAEVDRAARAQLDEMKRTRQARLVPMVIPSAPVPAAAV